MKKGVLKIVFAVLILLPVCANATIVKDFYTDGQIVDGNVFDVVNVWDSATVNMTGGQVFDFNTYQASIVNFSGGDVAHFYAQGASQLNVSGGWIHNSLNASGSSVVNFTGGETHGSYLTASDYSIINIYGYNLHFSGSYVIGNWGNGAMFAIAFRPNTDSHIVLHEIPELTTFLIFGLGCFLVKRRS